MAIKSFGPKRPQRGRNDAAALAQLEEAARKERDARMAGYREQSLRIHPWVCARCGRIFERDNLFELTVHHRDHNHDNNPPDGSNWENLCIYCHDNEHARQVDHLAAAGMQTSTTPQESATHSPFAQLAQLLNKKPGSG